MLEQEAPSKAASENPCMQDCCKNCIEVHRSLVDAKSKRLSEQAEKFSATALYFANKNKSKYDATTHDCLGIIRL